jgi:hypothetical protein
MGGSGKRQLADGSCIDANAIGKLRGLRAATRKSRAEVRECHRASEVAGDGWGSGLLVRLHQR